MDNFWAGFEKRADFVNRAMQYGSGLVNRVAQSGFGQAVGRGVQQVGNTMVGSLPIKSHLSNAAGTLSNITGVHHLRQGTRQVNKLFNSGAINEAGQLVNPAMQGAAAAAHQNLMTGAKRLGGTALAVGGTMYAGKKLFGKKPQQQQTQQAPAQMPSYPAQGM